MSQLLDIVRGERRTEVWYSLNFWTEYGCGFGFPCDENGVVNLEELSDCAMKNLEYCKAHPEEFPYAFNEVEKRTAYYREPDIGKCSCGVDVELINEYMGACRCKKCGQWYSIFGQELLDPEYWED
jgi:hypothetical protein